MRISRSKAAACLAVVMLSWAVVVPTSSGATTRTATWARAFTPDNGAGGTSIAMSPDGTTVYLGGFTLSAPHRFLVAAHATATGERRWLVSVPCGVDPSDPCRLDSLRVSPSGGNLFVTGRDVTGPDTSDWVTMALDTATGAPIWTARASGGFSGISQLAVSPAGNRVYVAGWVGSFAGWGERVIAYDATTGAELWRVRRAGHHGDVASLAVTPDGGRILLSAEDHASRSLETTSLAAATGAVKWSHRYLSPGMTDWPAGLALAPNGVRVFVTDYREGYGDPIGRTAETLAYRVSDGRLLWKRAEEAFWAPATEKIAVVAGGERVFLTDGDWTVARAVGTGRLLWTRLTSPGFHTPWWTYDWNLALSPHADRLFVSDSVCTVARQDRCWLKTDSLDAKTGTIRWMARRPNAAGAGLVVGPSGGRVYVGGSVVNRIFTFLGTLVMAYRT